MTIGSPASAQPACRSSPATQTHPGRAQRTRSLPCRSSAPQKTRWPVPLWRRRPHSCCAANTTMSRYPRWLETTMPRSEMSPQRVPQCPSAHHAPGELIEPFRLKFSRSGTLGDQFQRAIQKDRCRLQKSAGRPAESKQVPIPSECTGIVRTLWAQSILSLCLIPLPLPLSAGSTAAASCRSWRCCAHGEQLRAELAWSIATELVIGSTP